VPKIFAVLSGEVSTGKSTLCDRLVDEFNAFALKTKEVLTSRKPGIEQERGVMQRYGEQLDRTTRGAWVCEALAQKANGLPDNAIIIVDAVRIQPQVDAIRRAYGPSVVHIHLSAEKNTLVKRYESRKRSTQFKEFSSYSQLSLNKTERQIKNLEEIADVVIQTDRCTREDVLVRAAAHLGLYGRDCRRLVDVLIGGEYGSEGKGHIASYLAREYQLLVRVGGPNAGHKVFEDPLPYTHHLLPCGTRSTNAHLVIGPGAVLELSTLLEEIAQCKVPATRLSIDPKAMMVEVFDKELEAGTLVKTIGSTGQGVGSATARKVMRGSDVRLAGNIRELRPFLRDTLQVIADAFAAEKRILLEGTQGVGLSLHHGFYPHVTSRDTCASGCLAEAGISARRVRRIIMVCRSYPIRVQSPKGGTSGRMSQNLTWKEISHRSGIPEDELHRTERTSTTNRKRRVGEFDWSLLRRAVSLNAPTDIALTFADYVSIINRDARRFEQLTPETIQFIEEIERVASAPVSLISTRFDSRSIIDRRAW